MSTQHDRFLARLDASRPGVEAVADWLVIKGRNIYIPPHRRAPSADRAMDYVDEYDIMVDDDKPIQVKHLKWDFTGRHDFKYSSAFFQNKAAFERATMEMVAYVILSQDMRTAAIVLPHTRDRWHIVTTWVANTGNVESNYACPRDCLVFRRVAIESERAR